LQSFFSIQRGSAEALTHRAPVLAHYATALRDGDELFFCHFLGEDFAR